MAKKAAPKKKKRPSWIDPKSEMPLIETYAKQLKSYVQTMADGKVDAKEIKDQEKRLVSLMKVVEPLLDDDLHEKVTELICELTAYDLMQMMHLIQASRPATHQWRP